MTYVIRAAKRSEAKPLIGLYAETSGGKTFGSLLLARGFVGPTGRIIMIETEGGRGEAYSDKNEYPEIGGYEVIPMRDSFSPRNYGEAIDVANKAMPDALILDSGSHEWEGIGGVLSMAADNEAAGKKGQLIWQKPKIEHQTYFMGKLTQSPIPLVICNMRAKYPMEKKGSDWARSTVLEPKQSEDILSEMFIHGWLDKDHKFHQGIMRSRVLDGVFPKDAPLTIETGKKLAQWAQRRMVDEGAQVKAPAQEPAKPTPWIWLSSDGRTIEYGDRDRWRAAVVKGIERATVAEDLNKSFLKNAGVLDKITDIGPDEGAMVGEVISIRMQKVEQLQEQS